MTQGKIERWHRSMKNVVRLENHYSRWELERAVARFVDHYNYERLHEAIGNVTPDDMYHGRQRAILSRREKTKRLTLKRRKKENLRNAA
jgi:transposase InsO family protein